MYRSFLIKPTHIFQEHRGDRRQKSRRHHFPPVFALWTIFSQSCLRFELHVAYMGQGRVGGWTKPSAWKFQLKGCLRWNVTCVSAAHLSHNALNMSRVLVLRCEVRTLRACNSLSLSTGCCKQLKASGRLFLSYSDFLVIMSWCLNSVLLVIRVKGYLLRDTSIYLYIFSRGCPCYCPFQRLCPFLFIH